MTSKWVIAVVGLVAVVGVCLAVGLSSPSEVVLGDDCEPKGVAAEVQATLQGRRFWENQAGHVDQRIEALRQLPNLLAQVDELLAANRGTAEKVMDDLYSKHPELRPSASRQEAAELRAKADLLERAETDALLERIRTADIQKWSDCRRLIEWRLRR